MNSIVRYFSIVLVAVFSCATASARPALVRDTLSVPTADSLSVQPADTVELSDSAYMAQRAAELSSKEVKVVNRGFDVSRMVNARRQRAADFTKFSATPFMANTFVSARARTIKMLTEDYSFGLMGGVSFGKWLHEDHAVRLGYSVGKWQDNFDGSPITAMELEASYLFNLSSYVGGYRTNRLCEVMIVSGIGYANSFHQHKLTHAFSAHVGANVNLRLFKNIDFFIEPAAALYTNGMAVSYAGNWRTWLSAFHASAGLTYDIMPSRSPDSPGLKPRTDGWFVSLYGGPHFQNSDLVYDHVGLGTSLGVHMALGIGKYYTDFFAFRFSGAFSRGTWVQYGDEEYPCNYFVARAEGVLDFVSLLSRGEKKPIFAASLVLGPEIGYMHKIDHELKDNSKELIIGATYLGLTGGVQLKARLTPRFSLFLEPRFSLIPYEAPFYDDISLNDYRNYYDGVFNFNFGIEFLL